MGVKTPCNFCGRDLKLDLEDVYSEENYRKICIHVWMHHAEDGVPLRTILENGPSGAPAGWDDEE